VILNVSFVLSHGGPTSCSLCYLLVFFSSCCGSSEFCFLYSKFVTPLPALRLMVTFCLWKMLLSPATSNISRLVGLLGPHLAVVSDAVVSSTLIITSLSRTWALVGNQVNIQGPDDVIWSYNGKQDHVHDVGHFHHCIGWQKQWIWAFQKVYIVSRNFKSDKLGWHQWLVKKIHFNSLINLLT